MILGTKFPGTNTGRLRRETFYKIASNKLAPKMKENHTNIFASTFFLAILSNRWVISGFRDEADEICSLPGNYAAGSGHCLPTFRDNQSVPSSTSWPLKTGLIGCPETSVRNYHYSPRNKPEEDSSLLTKTFFFSCMCSYQQSMSSRNWFMYNEQ